MLRVLALLLAVLSAGCAMPLDPSSPSPLPLPLRSPLPSAVMDWSPGNWWSYHATIGNQSFDLAMIVHETRADGFQLGTNLSVGFFGLPFSGNVTEQFNPRIGPDVWPLFSFPLADGKAWGYTLFGHQAKTVARAATIDVPGVGPRSGYHLESTSFGQLFARYDYSPETGWFTRLQLIEPTDGSTVLLAELTSFGRDWDEAYYLEETVRELRVEYPTLPDHLTVDIPDGYLQARAIVTAEASAGAIRARVLDGDERVIARAEALVRGATTDRASARTADGATWTLDHTGAGVGLVYLEVTGVSATGPLAPPRELGIEFDLSALLQSTLPAWPQDGQTISTGPPAGLAVYGMSVPH